MSKALDTSIAKARVAIGHFTSPKNSISCNCQKISNQTRKPETILEIRKKTTFVKAICSPIVHKSLQYFTANEKKTYRTVYFSCRVSPNILKHMGHR